MKIAVIGFNTMIRMPYMRYYKRLLEAHGVVADYYCWDRTENGETLKQDNVINIKIRCGEGKIAKIFAMLKWRKKILQNLKREKYDKIIVLTTLPGVLLKKYLLKNYKGKYLLDVRDFTYDNIRAYQNAVKELCDNSVKTFISSPGFRQFLLSDNLMQIHNIDVERADYDAPDLDKNILTLGYIGQIAFEQTCIALLNKMNGSKYFLYFAGIYKNDNLREYCLRHNIENVKFDQRFDSADKQKIYQKIDLVNCYPLARYALPNRLYDAVYCKRPILALDGTALANIVKKYDIGIVVDESDDVKNALDEYVEKFDKNKFCEGIERCIADIEKEQSEAVMVILEFAEGK